MERRARLTSPDGSEHELSERLTVGRAPENDLVFPSSKVSRHHAELRYDRGRWLIEDYGSFNGTYVNGMRLQPGVAVPLHHADRIEIGPESLLFSWPTQAEDPETTEPHERVPAVGASALSPFQAQVVRCLCGPWLAGASFDALPSNEQIAAALGTPGAAESVKAALRRVYAKAGLSGLAAREKRRALCVAARQNGWV